MAERVRCVAFTDAVHSVSDTDPADVRVRVPVGVLRLAADTAAQEFLQTRTVNWVTAKSALDTPEGMRSATPCVSAGA
jgi:hypothetical protein